MAEEQKDPEHKSGSGQPAGPGHEHGTSPQGNRGTFSDAAPGLVPPSHLNEGDTGSTSDKPEAGGQLDFDDGDMINAGRGRNVRMGGTWAAQGADSAPLGAPAEILSDSNLPSDGPRRDASGEA
jgi:hypothetical protein